MKPEDGITYSLADIFHSNHVCANATGTGEQCMMDDATIASEVARLRRQIELEYEAAQRALTAPAITARHDFITQRMENMSRCVGKLVELVGPQQAGAILWDRQSASMRNNTDEQSLAGNTIFNEGDISMQETKLTMLEIWQRHRDALQPLVTSTGLPVMTIFSMFIGLAVIREEAETVLNAINELAGTHYTLDEIAGIQLAERDDEKAMEMRERAIRTFFKGVEVEERPIIELHFQYFARGSQHLRVLVKTEYDEVALDFPARWQAWQYLSW
jgi:hypothetical protein